ncbi:MAG: Rrf2 family transcriptional regulator [Nitrospiraceae bacterium]|nr:MAG: Rrf2 family transcriptional regulator [Nitrospiraceae bacterium]
MITRKTDYAIRCVLHLAGSKKEVVMVNEIAEERDIPRSFLAKILQTLAKAGIVESLRGIQGGFKLSRKPSEITLLDVVVAMEGTVAMNICAVDKKQCSFSSTCVVHPVWVDIRRDVEERLRQWDFARLLNAERN